MDDKPIGAGIAAVTAMVTVTLQIGVQYFVYRWNRANEEIKAARAEKAELRGEQKRLAAELLQKIEKFLTVVSARRYDRSKPARYGGSDDPMETLREEIAAQAIGFTDGKARELMDNIDTAMHLVLDPSRAPSVVSEQTPHVYGIRVSAREVLGAVIREESFPDDLPMLRPHLRIAKEVEDEIERMHEGREEYEEMMERDARERRSAVQNQLPATTVPEVLPETTKDPVGTA